MSSVARNTSTIITENTRPMMVNAVRRRFRDMFLNGTLRNRGRRDIGGKIRSSNGRR